MLIVPLFFKIPKLEYIPVEPVPDKLIVLLFVKVTNLLVVVRFAWAIAAWLGWVPVITSLFTIDKLAASIVL